MAHETPENPQSARPSHEAAPTLATSADTSADTAVTLTVEDTLLALFQPASGTIAGENTLFYVLAGAVLADLAEQGRVRTEDRGLAGTVVTATGERPADPLLQQGWDYLAKKPRGVQGALAAIGPALRTPTIDRVVARGDLVRTEKRVLGLFASQGLALGATGRRETLISGMRAALVDGDTPSERIAAVTALVSASGALPVLHEEIPWTGDTAARARALHRGDWPAGAAAEAVTRTMIAIVTNAVVAGAVAASR